MVPVENQAQPAGAVPFQIAADRAVDRTVRGQRAGDRQILAGAEAFRIEVRASGRAIGPAAAGLVVVEPHPDAAGARIDGVLRIRVIDQQRERVGRLHLQHQLAVDAFAVQIGKVIPGVLGDLIDIGRVRAVFGAGKVAAPVVGVQRQRTPVVFRTKVAFAPARVELGLAGLAALIRCGRQDADGAIGKSVRQDARHFRGDRRAFEARGVIDALDADAALEAGAIQRTRGLDVDDRTNAAGGQAGTARLVHFHPGDAFGGEVAEIEAARGRRFAAAAQARCGHLAAVQQHQVEVRAEPANGDGRAFTAVAVNRHAGDALERFGQVGIGELADVFSGDRVDDALRFALHIQRCAQAGADAGDDDGIAFVGGSGAVVLGQRRLRGHGDRGGGNTQHQAAQGVFAQTSHIRFSSRFSCVPRAGSPIVNVHLTDNVHLVKALPHGPCTGCTGCTGGALARGSAGKLDIPLR